MITYGFFNALLKDGEPDRKYNSEQMSEYFEGLISDGVYENVGGALQVKAGTGMTVQVQPGRALIDCHWVKNDSVLNIDLSPAHVTLNRYTNIVARLDYTTREINIIAVDGENATEPVRPDIVRSQTVKDLLLAVVYVAKATEEITQSTITDTRADTNSCGWVTGVIRQVDTSTLFLQWQTAYEEFYADMEAWKRDQKAAFDTWLTDLTEQLRVNTYIEKYQNIVKLTANTTSQSVGITEYDSVKDVLMVYVNGIALDQGSEFTVSGAGNDAKVTFTYTMNSGNTITFVAIKSKIGFEIK